MKILLIGSGGREHVFAWKMMQSPHCESLFIAPGNAGTAQLGTNVSLRPTDFEGIKAFVLQEGIEMVVVGPEVPLVEGIYDYFKSDMALAHCALIGPSKAAAQLEGSKDFAKRFMQEMGIPTAAYQTFNRSQEEAGVEYISQHDLPIVLKADGLAAGKGVVICEDRAEAIAEFRAMLAGKFKKASQEVVVESFLKGIEFSVFVLTDGKTYKLLPVAKDYKRIGEGDTGLNTGGMGAISPVPFVDEALMQKVVDRIIEPTIAGIQKRGLIYEGFIFFGLIEVDGDPFVIEYNCRMGDPETQVVFPRLKQDLVQLFLALDNGQLADVDLEFSKEAAASVIMVSGGYPEAYEKGKVISGLDQVKDNLLFQAGTKVSENGKVVTNGGRVLAVTSLAEDFELALKKSYEAVRKINYDGRYFRNDIGFEFKKDSKS